MSSINKQNIYDAAAYILEWADTGIQPKRTKRIKVSNFKKAVSLLKFENMISYRFGQPKLTDMGLDRVKAFGYVVYPPLDITKNPR